jgi:cytochrome c oxidase cbb3-type subunit 3
MAQLASYVKSLHGTKPAKPKEPQGVLLENNASIAADSTKVQSGL